MATKSKKARLPEGLHQAHFYMANEFHAAITAEAKSIDASFSEYVNAVLSALPAARRLSLYEEFRRAKLAEAKLAATA